MMPRGVSLKCARTSAVICCSGIRPVPSVCTITDTGSATPMAYASCTSARSAMPAATTFFAM